jgi:DNA-binding GntR family transcriptional regulator
MSAKHNQIANHLITDILDGNYRVGERLPVRA